MRAYITRYILISLLSFGLPTCIQAVVTHCFRTSQGTIPDDSLYSSVPVRSVDIAETMSTLPPIYAPKKLGETIKSEPVGSIVPASSDSPLVSNAGYSVGTPEGAVSVDNFGAAVYSLKIEVPNGGSLTPQIGLSYNSQSGGYGLAGYGFNMTGFSAITRGGHNLFHDGRQAGVTYTASDNLFIDGKRLILQSGTSGQNGATYTVEGDPFTKVIVHGKYNNRATTTWFEVTTNTGMTYQYGNSPGSKIAYKNKKGNSRIASWYVNKATDKYSNYITYEYAISNLSIRPTTVTYGMNSARNRGIVNKVSFAYRSLGGNARSFAIEDQQGKTDLCLSSVTTTSNNSVYRKYTFSYNDDSDRSTTKWTRLVTVEETNGKGEKLPPVKFTWQYLPSPGVHSSQLPVSTGDSGGASNKRFMSVDLNGDGISDIIRVSTATSSYGDETRIYVSRSNISSIGIITYDRPIVYRMPSGSTPFPDKINFMFGGSNVMDYDGDGYNDLLFPLETVQNGKGIVVFYVVAGSNVVAGEGGILRPAFSMNPKSVAKVPLYVNMDVDGNGTDDVIAVEQNKKDNYYPCTILQYESIWSVAKLTEVKLTLPQGVSKDIEKVFVGDYNNDGLSDLILLYDGGYKVYFNNGGTVIASRFTESNTKSSTDFGNYWRVQQGDFDGDGLSDFVYNKSGESCLWIAHNNGNGTFTHTKSVDIGVANNGSNKDDSRFSLMAYDIDHDGRTDVMVCKAGYRHRGFPKFKNEYTNTQVKWLYSTGADLKLVYSYTKNREDDANESSIFLGDFDGDGYPELANYGSLLSGTDNTFSEKINVYKSGYRLSQVGKITAISDGMGNDSYIRYVSATSPTVYKKSIESAYPVNTYTLPLSVVKDVTSDDGAAGSQVTNYFYEDLRLHIAGRGMLGFNAVTKENTKLGTEETEVMKWDERRWIPLETKTVTSVDGSVSTICSVYKVCDNGKNNYFSYVSTKNITDFDGNTAEVTSVYDMEKGVPVSETVCNDGADMYKQVNYKGYMLKSGMWMPTSVERIQKHKDDPVPFTVRTSYAYNDRGDILNVTENDGSSAPLTTTNTYDSYGNMLTSSVSGSGIGMNIRSNVYDATGRFVVKATESATPVTNTFTYDEWGNVLTETDATNPQAVLTTAHVYDGWGREVKTTDPAGLVTTIQTGWGDSDGEKYFILTTPEGGTWVKTWYDNSGRETLVESMGPKNMTVYKQTSYDSKGQVWLVTTATGQLETWERFAYDGRGRVTSDVLSSGRTTTYSYGNRTVTSTVDGKSSTKTTDAWGNVVKSTDPVSEVTYMYASCGKPSQVTAAGATTVFEYDDVGRQTSMTDPDAGTTTYTYTADGKLLTQTDARGVKTTNTYDDVGRLVSSQIGETTITHTYGESGNEATRLVRSTCGDNTVTYTYDRYGRVVTENRTVGSHGTLTHSYVYNEKGQLAQITYPGGLTVDYGYDDLGNKVRAKVGEDVVYNLEHYDGVRNFSSFKGSGTMLFRTLDKRGFESNVRLLYHGTPVMDYNTVYDGVTGNLLSRQLNDGVVESFSYDALDRLVSAKSGDTETLYVGYAPNGNIVCKTGVGNYTYTDSRPHAVMEVDNIHGQIPDHLLTTNFNDLGKIKFIVDEDNRMGMNFCYGPDCERWYSEKTVHGEPVEVTIYGGDYERITEGGRLTREFYYLDDHVIAIKQDGMFKFYKAFTDNLGSILCVIDDNGNKVFEASYDAWGRQTVMRNDIGLRRGYTGHEMLKDFDIINMNGRLYDPVLGRFFSPDNYVQLPDYSQSFNRYSYCLNNPLKYTDPSGNLFGIDDAAVIAFAAFNMASSMMRASFEGKSVWKAGALSLLSSAASYGIGSAFGNAGSWGKELLRAGAHGLASGVVSALDGGNFASAFVSGAAASGIGSYAQSVKMNSGLMVASTTVMGGAVAWATGSDFLQGAMQGMKIGLFNHAMHDGNGDIKYYHDKNGNIRGEIPEVVVVSSRHSSNDFLGAAVGVNTILDGIGTSLKKNGGNSTWGSNRKFYWHSAAQRGFYGNQHVKTIRLSTAGKSITNVTGPVGIGLNVSQLGVGAYADYQNYQSYGYTDGYNTVRATADVVGGWTGAAAGLKVGTSIGSMFGGVGAIPGAIIGGAVGGIIGAYGGGWLATSSVDIIYGR